MGTRFGDGEVVGLKRGEADVDETRRRAMTTGGRDLTSTASWTEELSTEMRRRIGALRLYTTPEIVLILLMLCFQELLFIRE
ncbi:hypothetical protein Bca52824_011023 [Brassica carinata]|uniref:Uncharacterized protein n=1 Tax=Brassica carinata TaxID=52824 RepID=A0A8X7WFH0_BRACI|nr:hypothetical protein Bca52824_011023 [Brassica carinata]